MESYIESTVDLIEINNKTFDQIVNIFERVLDSIFEDKIYNHGRFIVIEKFAARIVERSTHLNTDILSITLNDRIVAVYLKWLDEIN